MKFLSVEVSSAQRSGCLNRNRQDTEGNSDNHIRIVDNYLIFNLNWRERLEA